MPEAIQMFENEFDYRGARYSNVINEFELKTRIKKKIEEKSLEIDDEIFKKNRELQPLFIYLLENKLLSVAELNNIILENIRFNCSNIFFDKTNLEISNKDIDDGIYRVFKMFSEKNVPVNYHEELNKSGYNLIDRINSKNLNELYFPVIEYDDNNINIMASVSFLDGDGNRKLRVCIVDIDRGTGYITFYVNGGTGSFKIKNDSNNNISSGMSFYKDIKLKIRTLFSLRIESHNEIYIENRAKMFQFCNEMNNLMISDYSETLQEVLYPLLKTQIRLVYKYMTNLNDKVKLSEEKSDRIMKRIYSNFLGEYITTGYTENQLTRNAKNAGALCYPTTISFKGQELSRGKASTRGKKTPLTFESIFYSLNTDIEIIGELDEFTLAWFDCNFFEKSRELDVSQTTIRIAKEYFSITLKNTKNKNKGMTQHIEHKIRNVIYGEAGTV